MFTNLYLIKKKIRNRIRNGIQTGTNFSPGRARSTLKSPIHVVLKCAKNK